MSNMRLLLTRFAQGRQWESALQRGLTFHQYCRAGQPLAADGHKGSRMRHVILSATLVTIAACAPGPDRDERPTATADTIHGTPLSLIGEVEGDREYLFGAITSVAVSAGVVYVADRIGSSVRAYSVDGEYLSTVGEEGEGPGEFGWPADLVFDEQGQLWVRDGRRITVFSAGAGSTVADSVVQTLSIGTYGNLSSTRANAGNGRYYYPAYLFREGDPNRYFYRVFSLDGPTADTVAVPALPNLEFLSRASYRLDAGSGRLLRGLNKAPFEPMASWDIGRDGTIYTTSGDRFEVLAWSIDGDSTAVVRLEGEPRSVPQDEFADSARSFRNRIDSLPVPMERVMGMSPRARAGELPTTLPVILALHTGPEGDIWLKQWPPTDRKGTTSFVVVSEQGEFRHTVVIAADLLPDPPPFVSREYVVGVVRDRDTGVERVAVFGLAGA